MVACEAPASAADVAPPILKLCVILIACSLELATEMLEKPESGKCKCFVRWSRVFTDLQ